MNGRQALTAALKATQGHVHLFLSDFSDADLLVRPVPNANHAAWQLGNVIVGDVFLVQSEIPSATYPALPAGFKELHGGDGASKDTGFLTKAEYLKHFDDVRAATIAALNKLTDADLDTASTGPMKAFAPTWGEMFVLVSNHTLMHAGQFSVIRRKLGKPVLF